MDISEDRKADTVVLALSGKLDVMTAKVFENKILEKSCADDMRRLET